MSTPPLSGLRVLDLSRILAGPTCTQLLADLGADVIKIERPGRGDDTRGWGPPFLTDPEGRETTESAYYLCANRGKRSVAVDISEPRGQEIVRALAAQSDVLIENFKAGDLARRGLDWAALSPDIPSLIYCSISGFGRTGPLSDRPGYDFMIQGMGGIMSLTGQADRPPMKVGVGIADVMCGMYAAVAILAALRARDQSGRGQFIDLALFDCQLAWLINQGVGYLTDGVVPPRRGNDHPTIVPYGTFPASDGDFIIAVGNDDQFARLCGLLDRPELAEDPRFARNEGRVRNRAELLPEIERATRARSAAEWIAALEAVGVPCGPVNDLAAALNHPQALARGMRVSLPHAGGRDVDLIGNPIRMSETPVQYTQAPPVLGEHTAEVLGERLGLSDEALSALAAAGTIQGARK